jgi:hypothetical protein
MDFSFPGFFDHSLSVKAVGNGSESNPNTLWWRSAMSCTGDSACPETNLPDVDARSNSANAIIGYADPALKSFMGTSWMAYSWPNSEWPNGVGTAPEVLNIQAHLAKSTNGGETWSFVGAEFGASGAQESVNLGPAAGGVQLGIASSEEIDIDAATLGQDAKPYWFWIRQKYYNPVSGSGPMKDMTQHLRIGMLQATEPTDMGNQEANEFVFYSPSSPGAFKDQVNAQSRGHADLVADLLQAHGISCDIQWSASVLYNPSDQHLYVLIECNLTGANAISGSTFSVLRVKPTDSNGNVLTQDQWSWEFAGSIGTPTTGFTQIAPAFRVDSSGTPTNMLIQPSLAWGADGALLLVSSPSLVDSKGSHRVGCNVTELTQNPLAMALDAEGNPKHRGIVRTPDLSGETFGDQAGSCDYDSGIGLYQARKVSRGIGKTQSSINKTGIGGL